MKKKDDFILFFISSWGKIASTARNWINYVTQTAATTFAFSSVYILPYLEGTILADGGDAGQPDPEAVRHVPRRPVVVHPGTAGPDSVACAKQHRLII